VREKARRFGLPVIYLNQVGGQDELVFDGSSLVADAAGEVAARLPAFAEALETVVFRRGAFERGALAERPQGAALIYRALVAGVRDYIEKNGFRGAALGLSGGIDSALTLAIAADAIGAKRVMAVMMPSRHTADSSIIDARAQAEALGARYESISIEPLYCAALEQLAPLFAGREPGVAEENLQARCRGMLLMAISNKFGCMVLNTGNKSEMAVGYATLYGDMVGGFSALKDVPKEMVYQLARHRNQAGAVIPERVIARAPTAELAPGQKDEDTLPPYAVLDPILEAFIRDDRSAEEIIAGGFDADDVHRVIGMVAANEYKRRQAAPGVRVTSRAFGKDRRYPITSGFFGG
ncbi:MAG: NAD+ synthase, partial [Gammaproteobacteria bacterium]